jgi:hypothetical protein
MMLMPALPVWHQPPSNPGVMIDESGLHIIAFLDGFDTMLQE